MSKKPFELLCSLKVGARNSPLSKKQVEEVQREISFYYPQIDFEPLYVKTRGDRDKFTSLRTLDKSDFFTQEVDELLLKGRCRLAIHSAKDLPDPLTAGLKLAALTQGVNSSDALVVAQNRPFPENGLVATSSERREENVRQLFPQARFVDIRGTIEERLEQLNQEKVDGVVVAEAALIRLQLTHLTRIKLPGETAPLQGRLALLIREDDQEMEAFLKEIYFFNQLC